MAPTIKARIGGAWVPVGGGGVDEVWIGTAAPTDTATELWYDTDEPNLYEPDTARWNSAWGNVVPPAAVTSNVDVTAGPTTVLSATFTAVAGRRYVVRTTNSGSYTTGQAVAQSWSVAVNLDGVYINGWPLQVDVADNYQTTATVTVDIAPAAGSRTVAIVINRNNGTGTLRARYFLAIDDVGPVALASIPPAQPSSVWTNVTFQNGWTNFITPPWSPGSYRLLGDKVELRGMVKGGTLSQAMFTLPVGYRPPYTQNWAVPSNDAFGEARVATDGTVIVLAPTSTVWVDLSGVSFSVTP